MRYTVRDWVKGEGRSGLGIAAFDIWRNHLVGARTKASPTVLKHSQQMDTEMDLSVFV
jgi:hypothetical protein